MIKKQARFFIMVVLLILSIPVFSQSNNSKSATDSTFTHSHATPFSKQRDLIDLGLLALKKKSFFEVG